MEQNAFILWCLSNGYVFKAWYLVMNRDNFTFTSTFNRSVRCMRHPHDKDDTFR